MAEDATRAEVNRLYWETDRSVADIADDLGVSRRSLYEQIDARPAGRSCPECGEPLGFRNRTAVDNLEAECAACGYEAVLDGAPDPVDYADPELEQERDAAPLAPIPPRPVPARGSGTLLGGTLLAGLAAGAAAAWLIRRR